MTVARILKDKGRQVVTLAPDQTMDEAAALMSDKRIGAVLVTSGDGAIVGILSERDIVRAVAARGGGALAESVSGSMTRRVVTCTPDTRIQEVMEIMTAGKFRHLPVLEHGGLAGVVSIGDVVKHRLAEMAAENKALEDYIHTA